MWSHYLSLFKSSLRIWCLGTCIVQFIVFLLLFILTTYLSTLLDIRHSSDYTKFVSEYEKYVVLSIGIYFIVPFAFSNVLLFGIFQKNIKILTIYIRGTIFNSILILLVVLGSGIYVAIDGTPYVAYSLIGSCIILDLLLLHSILIVLGLRDKITKGTDEDAFERKTSETSSDTRTSDDSD